MDDERLAEIRARCDAIMDTPRPWCVGHALMDKEQHRTVHDADGWLLALCDFRNRPSAHVEAIVAFIAGASTDVPDLLDEITRLRAELQAQSDDVQEHWASPCEVVGIKQEIARLRNVLAEERAECARLRELVPGTDDDGLHG